MPPCPTIPGMSTSTIPDASIVCAPRGALAARLPIVAALIFSAGRTVIVLTGGLPWPGLDKAVGVAPSLLALVAFVPLGLSSLGPWRRPARLVGVGPGRLRVPPGQAFRWYAAGQVVLLTALATTEIDVDLLRDPGAPAGAGHYLLAAVPVVLAAVAGLLIVVFVAAVFDGRPRVDLTPSGVEVRDPFGRRTVPWEALAPGTPLGQSSGSELVLTVTRPELVQRRGFLRGSATAPRLTLTWLRVQPWFLADVLRWYVDHPAERAALGTPAGDERLRRALGVG